MGQLCGRKRMGTPQSKGEQLLDKASVVWSSDINKAETCFSGDIW